MKGPPQMHGSKMSCASRRANGWMVKSKASVTYEVAHMLNDNESYSANPALAPLMALELLSLAAQAADGEAGSFDKTFEIIEKCMETARHIDPQCLPAMAPIYDAILSAATFNRQQIRELDRKSESLAFVYFMRRTDGLIKIGYSYDPKKRLFQVRAQCKQQVDILATVQGAKKLEGDLHKKYAADRVEGEWFAESPELLAEIERHRTVPAASHE